MRTSICFRCLSKLSVVLLCALPTLGADSGYHLLNKYTFGAAPGGREYFDYITVDAAARRVYMSHGTEVLVADADSGALVGQVPGLTRCHGIALAKNLGRGFISDGDQGKIVVFDLKTLKVISQVDAAKDADCIIYDPGSKHVLSFNGDSQTSTVVDPATGKVVGTITLPGAPEFAVADGHGLIYNNLEDKNEVEVIDSRALKVKSEWPVAPAGTPTALAADFAHHRLFIAGRNPAMLVIMDADNGKVIQSFPISGGADANYFDSGSGQIFVSTGEGYIHVFHQDSPDHYSEVEKVKTERGAKTMSFDAKTGHIFVDTSEFGPAPAPTAEHPHPRPAPIPGTFHLLVYGK